MKALVYTGPEQLAFQEVQPPEPGTAEVLIRVDSVGICGSDMHAFLGHDARRPAPLILGHEVSGRIVGGPGDGQNVTVNPLVTCGACRACRSGHDNLCADRQIISMPPREGGFAQFLKMPTANLVQVPAGFPIEKASLAEPLACGWHAVRLAKEKLGSEFTDCRALVIGGGAIGLGAALALTSRGISDITIQEPNPARRAFISERTGFHLVNPDELSAPSEFDLVIDGVGIAPTRRTASTVVRPGGVIMHIGLGSGADGLDIRRMTLQEITFIGTYTYTAADFRATAQAMFDGAMGALDWFETRPLADGMAAFKDISSGAVQAPKVILKPWP